MNNTSLNTGVHNSIKTRVLQKNDTTCHIIHNSAQNFSEVYCASSKVEFLIDLYFCLNIPLKGKMFRDLSVIFVDKLTIS